jgi:dTDP-D-glucose 4,6-dehydratase
MAVKPTKLRLLHISTEEVLGSLEAYGIFTEETQNHLPSNGDGSPLRFS